METKLWFLKRGYPENIIDQELGRLNFLNNLEKLTKEIKVYV